MTVTSFVVPDIHCDGCAARIERALGRLADVRESRINTARQRVYVTHDDRVNPLQLLDALEAIGFHPTLGTMTGSSAADKHLLKRLGVAGLVAMQVMTLAVALYLGEASGMAAAQRELLRWAALVLTVPVVTYAATPFLRGAWHALAERQLNMDVPIALAIGVAFAASAIATLHGAGEVYFDSVVMFTFLLLLARFVDSRMRGRLDASAGILRALPEHCMRLTNGVLERVPLSQVRPADVLWVKPDNRVPADGSLDGGRAWVDESILSGESGAVEKHANDPLYAGTLVKEHGLQMAVAKCGPDTRLASIDAIARRAELSRPRLASVSDRVARLFVAGILTCALVTYLAWSALEPARALPAMLAVLVISCPCALSLAIPAAMTAALVRFRTLGAVVFDRDAIERLAAVDRLLIDKTGTLTTHVPTIESMVRFDTGNALDPADPLALAQALQRHSNHPLASAFALAVSRALPQGRVADVALEDVRNITGAGVEGWYRGRRVRVGSAGFCGAEAHHGGHAKSVYLTVEAPARRHAEAAGATDLGARASVANATEACGNVIARFDIAEEVRDDAKATLAQLARLGVQARITSGDSKQACERVATALAIPYAHSQTPEDKLAAVAAEHGAGRHVLAIGDGINDVPLLAAADVSVAVLETPDTVRERADILLLTRKLAAIPALLRVARKTGRIVRQNLIWAVAYNITAIPLAALGYVPPWVAALGMSASSLAVMANSTRVLRTERG